MHPPEPTKNQTLAHLSTPAYPTARFNSTGHCIHHHSVRLCQVTADKKFKIIRKTCFKCGSAGLMSDGPAGGGGSGAGSRKQTIHGYKKKEWKGREVRGDLLTAGTAAGSGMHDSVTGNTSHKGDGRKKKSENSKKNKHKNARVARETIVQEVESDTSKDSDDSDDDDSSDEEGLEEENGRSKINNGGSNKDFEVSENFDDLFNNNNGTNEKASASTPSATPASTPVRPTRTRLSHSLNYGTSFPINNPLVASSHANYRATLNARDGATAVAPPDWNHDNNNKTIASSRQERSNRNNAISNSSSSNGPKTLSSFSERKDRSRTLSPPKHRDGTTSNSSNENNNKSNNLNNPVTNSSNVYSTFFTPTPPLKKKISIGSLKQKLAMPLTSPLQKKKVHSYSGNGVNGAHHMISGLPMMPLPIHQENGRKNGTGSDTDQDTAKDAKEGINTRGRDNINRNSASYSKEAKQHSRHGGLAALSAIGGGSLRHLPHLHSHHYQQNNQQSKSQVIITPDFSLVADVNNSNDTHHHIAAVTQRSGGGNGSGNGGGGVSVTSASTNTTTTDNHSIPDLHTIHTMPTSNMTNSKNNPYAVSSYYGSGHNHQQQQQQHPYHSYSTAFHSSDVPNEIMDPAPTSAKYCATNTGKTNDSSNNNSPSNGTTTSKNNNKGGRPFNTYGYCNFHPEIQLAKKNFKGTWKVVHETCPACALEDMAKRSSTRNDRRRSGGDSKSRSRSRSGGSGSRRSRRGSDTANGYGHERRSSSKSKGRGNNDDRRREKCHAVGENRDDYNDDDIDVGYNEENDHENNRSRSANSGNRRPESRDPHENEKSRRGRETTAIHNGRLLLEGPSATSTSRSKTRDVDDDNDYQRDRRRRSTSKSRSRSKSQGLLRSGIGSRSKSPIPARLSRSIQQNRDGGGSKSRSHAVPSRTSRQSLNRIQPKPRSKSPPVYSNKHRLGIGSRSKSPVPRSLSTTNPINKNVSNRDNGGVHSGDVRGNTSNLGNSIKRVQNQNNRTPGMDNGDKHNNKSKALETNGNDDGNTNVTRNGHSIKNKTNGKTNTTRNETKTPMTESPNGYYNRNDSGSASILSNASPDCNPSGTGPKVTTTSVADKSIPLSPAISETSKPAFSSSYFLRENDCSGLNNDLDLIANEIGLPAKLLRRSYNHKNDDDEDDDNNVKSSPSGSPTPMSTVTTPGSTVTSSSCCSSMRVMSTPPSSTPKKDGMRTKTGTSGKHINVPPIPPPPLATFKSARQIHRDREKLNLLVRSSLKD